tara:strand:- start:438 stop:1046 length:609 start_codon:yes stop_codon:yes gene_type:complete
MVFFNKSSKDIEEQAQADFEEAKREKLSEKNRAFKMKIAHRTRAHIDLTFIEGAQKLGKYHQANINAIAQQLEGPERPSYSPFQKIKTLDSEVIAYLPSFEAQQIFDLGGKYQIQQINVSEALTAVQSIADTIFHDFDISVSLSTLGFLRDEIERNPALAKSEPTAENKTTIDTNGDTKATNEIDDEPNKQGSIFDNLVNKK